MATDVATTNMGEVDEIHKKEDETTEGVVINGNTSDNEMETQECETPTNVEMESMEVDEEIESKDVIDGDDIDDVNGDEQDRNSIEIEHTDDKSSINDEEDDDDEDKEEEVQEIEDDEVVISIETKENGTEVKETIELNDDDEDSEREEGEVLIIDNNTPKENGTSTAVIDLQTPEKTEDDEKKLEKENQPTPRRSSRNLNRQQKRYSNVEIEEEEKKITITTAKKTETSEESDVEEVLPEDPLANIGDAIHIERIPSIKQKNKQLEQSSGGGGTIVVKDTKKLVEIASKTSSSNSIGKKEPTLVIIDTNSILSGRGPVPVNKNYQSSNLPIGLPAQGIYPANMRATITPIPMSGNSNSTSLLKSSTSSSSNQPVLPTLTDDMFVVEAPSFIVPYVYEKPPVKNLKTFVKDYKKDVDKLSKKKNDDDTPTPAAVVANDEDSNEKETNEDEKMYSYFGSPLGKFFIEIGLGLVQEFVQSDLLKQQKRKRDRERGKNPETLKTITSLTKNLEYTKENNEPYRLTWKKCEFCPFKSESSLAMSYHLETPHLKNYIYKCNFCTYETRSPHDILFHMEAEHCVRGRLERALSFHQCPNCPFEENQKGKLSRHMMACAKKFKPDRNLEPPLDWEPPAKIPRVPKMRPGLNTTSSAAYQAMSKATLQQQQQIQLLTKMQLQSNALLAKSGGGGKGGRATTLQSLKGAAQMIRSGNLPGMVYKQAMSGGSVLVPTNYQLSGNQVFTSSSSKSKPTNTPSISITPLPRASTSTSSSSSVNSSNQQHQQQQAKPGDTNSKNSFVICEICDGYIKDLEQLRNHMQWIHKVKIHPKMIYNRPPLNCQKCQFRFFTDQGLERHLLGSHGLVTSSMQDAANRSKDAGRCPICGRVYQWKLLNHVARDHNMTLKPAHLSYKCTVCTATFGMYKQFENHVYSAHSVVAKRVMDKKTSNNKTNNEQTLKPLKINDEITIIPQPAKNSTSKEDKSSASSSKNNEKKLNINNRSDRLTRRSSQMDK